MGPPPAAGKALDPELKSITARAGRRRIDRKRCARCGQAGIDRPAGDGEEGRIVAQGELALRHSAAIAERNGDAGEDRKTSAAGCGQLGSPRGKREGEDGTETSCAGGRVVAVIHIALDRPGAVVVGVRTRQAGDQHPLAVGRLVLRRRVDRHDSAVVGKGGNRPGRVGQVDGVAGAAGKRRHDHGQVVDGGAGAAEDRLVGGEVQGADAHGFVERPIHGNAWRR